MKKFVSGVAAIVLALSLSVSAFAAPSVTYPAEVSGATTAAGTTTRPNTTTTTDTTTEKQLMAEPLKNEDVVNGYNATTADGSVSMSATENADGTVSVQANLKTVAGDVPVTVSDTKTAAGLLNVVSLTAPKDDTGALLVDVAAAPVTDKAQVSFNANNAKAAKEMPITDEVNIVDLIKNTLANSDDAVKEALGAAGMTDADLENTNASITIDANGDSYVTTDNGFAAKINTETVAEQEVYAVNYTADDFPLTLDFAVPGAKKGMAYQVQHKMENAWQMEKTTVSVDKVSATVDGLSPFRVTLTTLEPIGAVVEAAPVTSEAVSSAPTSEAPAETPADESKGGFPIVPVAGGVGVAAIVAAVVGVRNSKKKETTYKKY